MRHARRPAVRGAVAGLLAALIIVVMAPSAAHAAPGAVTITPTTGLIDGQSVTVSGTGFAPNATAFVGMCAPGATTSFDCDSRQYSTVPTDATGSFTTEFQVIRLLRRAFTTSPTIDCATTTCIVGVSDDLTGGQGVFTPVQFADVPVTAPAIAASPDVGLVDAQVAQVSGNGFRAGETVRISQCPTEATSLADCDRDTRSALVDGAGDLTAGVTVDRVLTGLPDASVRADCAPARCSIGVDSIGGFSVVGVTFAEPTLTVTVDPLATLEAGSGDVVAQATITCDIATPVSLFADITQPDVQYRYVLTGQRCTPDEPLLAFLPSRIPWVTDASYALGPAGLAVTTTPLRLLSLDDPAGLRSETSAAIELIDFDAVLTVIQAGLADPNNTALREAFLRAIGLRLAQDPVFRQQWHALISGGG